MWTLKVCLGMWLGLCGSIFTVDYQSEAQCKAGRQEALASSNSVTYAICYPKGGHSK